MVWASITGLVDHEGGASEYVSVSDLERERLAHHPWSIGGGGAAELKQLLDERRTSPLVAVVEDIGVVAVLGEDEAMTRPRAQQWQGGPAIRLVVGEEVRDWSITTSGEAAAYPYDVVGQPVAAARLDTVAWPWRTTLANYVFFGKRRSERGLRFYDYGALMSDKLRTPLSIVFAEVATHNHFVLDRGGKVFNRTAPVVKLGTGASVDDHLALVGVLNSSTACFWSRQVFHDKGNGGYGGGIANEEWERFFVRDGTKLQSFPLPAGSALAYGRELDRLAQVSSGSSAAAVAGRGVPSVGALAEAAQAYAATQARMVAVQEELDWHVLLLYGLTDEALTSPVDEVPDLLLGERAFEIVLARRIAAGEEESSWFVRHGSTPITELPSHWTDAYRRLVDRRIELIESDLNVGLVERPEHKRRWNTEAWDAQVTAALRGWLLDRLESPAVWPSPALRTVAGLADVVRLDPEMMDVARQLGGQDVDVVKLVGELVAEEAVPFLAAHRYSTDGLRVRAQWEATWELQRAEDRGEDVGVIPVPPKYGQKDFARGSYWKLRVKLDANLSPAAPNNHAADGLTRL